MGRRILTKESRFHLVLFSASLGTIYIAPQNNVECHPYTAKGSETLSNDVLMEMQLRIPKPAWYG